MKIAHIIPNLRKGGAERLVIDIVRELKKQNNVDVRLVLFRNEIEYEIEDIINIVKIIPSSVRLSLWRWNNIQVSELQVFFDDFQPDIIHSHLFEAELVTRSCNYSKAMWYSHAHDNMVQLKKFTINTLSSKKLFVNFFEKRYLLKRYKANKGTHFIAISKDTEHYLQETISNTPIILLNNAINYKRFCTDIKRDIKDDKILKLINVGSFVPNKNQQLLLRIAEKLNDKNVNFEIHFLGDGKSKENIKEQSLTLGLECELIFHGSVDNVEEFLWNSDLYIHVSKSEAFGLTLVEAMAAGIPVITLDGKGNRDLIEEGKNGYMIYEEDPKLFADRIIELWNDKAKYKEISTYAQQYAEKYDIKTYTQNLLAIYATALNEN